MQKLFTEKEREGSKVLDLRSAEQASLWRRTYDGLRAPDWIFEACGFETGSLIASAVDNLTRTILAEVESGDVQRWLAELPAPTGRAAVAVFSYAFVHRGFSVLWTHSLNIDDASHDLASFAARYVHTITGDPDPAIKVLGMAAARALIDKGGEDGSLAALEMMIDHRAPPIGLAVALRDL